MAVGDDDRCRPRRDSCRRGNQQLADVWHE
jgi:hypothetical protein